MSRNQNGIHLIVRSLRQRASEIELQRWVIVINLIFLEYVNLYARRNLFCVRF